MEKSRKFGQYPERPFTIAKSQMQNPPPGTDGVPWQAHVTRYEPSLRKIL